MKSAMATVRLLGWSVWEKCWNCCQSLKRWDTHTHTDVFFLSDPSFCTHEGEETEGTPRRSLSALIGRFLHVPADSGAQVSAELLLSYSDLCCVQLSLQVSEIRIKPLWSFFLTFPIFMQDPWNSFTLKMLPLSVQFHRCIHWNTAPKQYIFVVLVLVYLQH